MLLMLFTKQYAYLNMKGMSESVNYLFYEAYIDLFYNALKDFNAAENLGYKVIQLRELSFKET